jgi:hypothetical protein
MFAILDKAKLKQSACGHRTVLRVNGSYANFPPKKHFQAFYGTRRFVAVLRPLTMPFMSQMNPVHSPISHFSAMVR